jgi:hypothetical protein
LTGAHLLEGRIIFASAPDFFGDLCDPIEDQGNVDLAPLEVD